MDSLVGPLGHVEKVELHAKNPTSVEYVRALVWINTEEPLQFKGIGRFKSGEVVPTELEYEKLIKICFTCKMLTHDQNHCPLLLEPAQAPASRKSRKELSLPSRSNTGRKLQQDDRVIRKGGKERPAGHTRSRSDLNPRVHSQERELVQHDRKGKKIAANVSQQWRVKERTFSERSQERAASSPKKITQGGKTLSGAEGREEIFSPEVSQDSP